MYRCMYRLYGRGRRLGEEGKGRDEGREEKVAGGYFNCNKTRRSFWEKREERDCVSTRGCGEITIISLFFVFFCWGIFFLFQFFLKKITKNMNCNQNN